LYSTTDRYNPVITKNISDDVLDFDVRDEEKDKMLAQYLHYLPFFKRFSRKKLIAGGYFKDMKVVTYKEKDKMLAQYLHYLPFFKRFSRKKLIAGGYFKDMKVVTYKEKDILLMPEKDQVYVLINGKVIMREHNTKEPIKIKIKQVCKPGYIFGVDQMDGGISNLPYVWGSI